jgi:hypothetical protein
MADAKDRLADRIGDVIREEEKRYSTPASEKQIARLASAIIERLGFTAQVESYAMPDSTSHRWVTPWQEGRP